MAASRGHYTNCFVKMVRTIGIKSRIQGMSRNKIVFCQDEIEGLTFINIGLEFAKCIQDLHTSSEYASEAKHFFEQTLTSDIIGSYLAITNISILFEPQLKLDLRQLIGSLSINKCLFIQKEGEIKDDKFYLMGDNHFSIDLQGLSYIEI